MGCWLGLVFRAVVLLSGDAGLFLAANPGGAIVTVLSKGIACGAAVGLCCRWLPPTVSELSILLSALAVPLVNTGVFLLGCRLFFMPLIHQWAQQAGYASAGAYLMVGMVGWNFLLETAVNMALTPMLAQLIRLGSRRCL